MTDYLSQYTGEDVDEAIKVSKTIGGSSIAAELKKLVAAFASLSTKGAGLLAQGSDNKLLIKKDAGAVYINADGTVSAGVLPASYGGSSMAQKKIITADSLFTVQTNNWQKWSKGSVKTIQNLHIVMAIWGNITQIFVSFDTPPNSKILEGNITNIVLAVLKQENDISSFLNENGIKYAQLLPNNAMSITTVGSGPVASGYLSSTGNLALTAIANDYGASKAISLAGTFINKL